MALQVITLDEMQAESSLAEVQALTESALEPLEKKALALLEAELGRRLTADATDVAVRVSGSGKTILPLPERLGAKTAVVSDALGDITDQVETIVNGWMLTGMFPHAITFRHPLTITGKWGLECPEAPKGVLMDVIEAMAVRKADAVSRRDELAPWGAVSDGALRADRDSSLDRRETLENLLRYDVKIRLRGFYRPAIAEAV